VNINHLRTAVGTYDWILLFNTIVGSNHSLSNVTFFFYKNPIPRWDLISRPIAPVSSVAETIPQDHAARDFFSLNGVPESKAPML
jgi:hypothetical protein